jgi:radical SAM protein with 4Fe4S-binding SPASM domain
MQTIKSHFAKYDVLQISVHGHNSKLHNKIVGRPDSFSYLTTNLVLLQSMDISVRISAVVTKENINNLTDIYAFIKQFSNVTAFVAQPTIPIGDANVNDSVSNEELLLSYFDVFNNRKTGDPKLALLMGHCFDVPEIKNYVLKHGKADNIQYCSAGRSRLSIEANGDVYPCHFLKYGDFLIGNIKNQSISEIWNNSPKLNNIRLGRDRDAYCNTCEMKEHCVKKGICTSYLRNKNINDKPINCFIV